MKKFDSVFSACLNEDVGPTSVPGSTHQRLKAVLDNLARTNPGLLSNTLFELLTEVDTDGILNDFHRQILSSPE